MLDTNLTIEKIETENYSPLPEDMYIVELFDITAKQVESYDSKEARKVDGTLTPIMETNFDFHFVLLNGEENGKSLRGRSLYHNFIPSYLYIGKKGKNKLYEVIEALQKHDITIDQEAFGITGKDLNDLVGKQARVGTGHKVRGEKTYSEIVKFYPHSTDIAPLTAQEKVDATPKPKDGAASVLPPAPTADNNLPI